MTQTLSIQAESLRIDKNKTPVLSSLNFTVAPGSITGLIGPSGSGKTTLMRAMVGVQQITSGLLTVLGQPAGSRQLRKDIGYVTQNAAVYDDLTVLQNIKYFAVLTRADDEQVKDIIKQVELGPQSHQLVASLSGGQRARVSLAIALLGNPKLLVMDEPTVGLDPLLREELWSLFARLAMTGKTLIISSHVMDEAEKCQNLLLLREGRLLWQNSREGLLRHTRTRTVQEAFLAIIKTEVVE